jgi:hypothetical protein
MAISLVNAIYRQPLTKRAGLCVRAGACPTIPLPGHLILELCTGCLCFRKLHENGPLVYFESGWRY